MFEGVEKASGARVHALQFMVGIQLEPLAGRDRQNIEPRAMLRRHRSTALEQCRIGIRKLLDEI
jgi:hypothetical protein